MTIGRYQGLNVRTRAGERHRFGADAGVFFATLAILFAAIGD